MAYYAEDGDVYGAAERLGVTPDDVLDFSSNVFPAPLPGAVAEAAQRLAQDLARYPDPEARRLCAKAAAAYGADPKGVLAGHGVTEFLYAVPRRMRPRRVVVLAPCYHDYWRAVEHCRGEAEGFLAAESDEFAPDLKQLESRLSGVDMVLIGNPNNPTGAALPADALRTLAQGFPSATFVADETYSDFVPEAGGATLLGKPLPRNMIVLRSLSPFHSAPGLRLGFMVADPEFCAQVQRTREPWTVCAAAQTLGLALFEARAGAAAIREQAIAERERLRDELARLAGLRVFRSQANFLLLKLTRPTLTSAVFCDRLLQQRLLIRNAAGFRGLDGRFVRVSVRGREDNDRLLEGVRAALDDKRWKEPASDAPHPRN